MLKQSVEAMKFGGIQMNMDEKYKNDNRVVSAALQAGKVQQSWLSEDFQENFKRLMA